MASREPLSRGDIMSRVGIERDVMTFWIRGGVLQPMAGPAGPGKHLRFAWYEANIAAIMNQLRILGVKIEGMLSIGRVYREAIKYFKDKNLNLDDIQGISAVYDIQARVERAIINNVNELNKKGITSKEAIKASNDEVSQHCADDLQYRILTDKDSYESYKHVDQKIIAISRSLSRKEFLRYVLPFVSVTNQPEAEAFDAEGVSTEEMTYFWRIGEGNDYRFAMGSDAVRLARKDGAISMIAVDVFTALYRVWNDPVAQEDGE